MRPSATNPPRRTVLRALALAPLAPAFTGRGRPAAQGLRPAPACRPTSEETEGPFFKPRSPQRASLLEPGVQGTRLVLTGVVLSAACRPVAGALLDFWQADAGGHYDTAGFRLRGHQYTDGAGRYRLETVVPGLYPGRTRHIHVKVQAPGRSVLTTQLYFPHQARNALDPLFERALLIRQREESWGRRGTFDFVL
ncbi:MAG TPA: intradiol ring-cleavage dioxygenase [Stellaceae bacterium]|nr:intradiol ring-cleavage dioxygenase [Stellaceae bacterium]